MNTYDTFNGKTYEDAPLLFSTVNKISEAVRILLGDATTPDEMTARSRLRELVADYIADFRAAYSYESKIS